MSLSSSATLPVPVEISLPKSSVNQRRDPAEVVTVTASPSGDRSEISPDALFMQRLDQMRLNSNEAYKSVMGELATRLQNDAAAQGRQSDPRLNSLIYALAKAGDSGELPDIVTGPARSSKRQHTGVRSYSLHAPATGVVDDDPLMQLFAMFDEEKDRALESLVPTPLPGL